MDTKSWIKSKTLWANFSAIVAAVGLVVQGGATWQEVLFPSVLALVNVVLRIITKQPLE